MQESKNDENAPRNYFTIRIRSEEPKIQNKNVVIRKEFYLLKLVIDVSSCIESVLSIQK